MYSTRARGAWSVVIYIVKLRSKLAYGHYHNLDTVGKFWSRGSEGHNMKLVVQGNKIREKSEISSNGMIIEKHF